MRHPRGVRRFCLFLFTFALATALLLTFLPASAAPDDNASTTADWRDGELVPPLPTDPTARAQAIRSAREVGRARMAPGTRVVGARATALVVEALRGPVTPPRPGERIVSTPPPLPFRRPLRPTDAPPVKVSDDVRAVAPVSEALIDPASMSSLGTTALSGGFDAVDDTGWKPASPDIAVGGNRMVVVTNDVFSIYDKCGNLLMSSQAAPYFGLSTSYYWYDPRVVYDAWDDRWVMAYIGNDFTSNQSRIVLIISKTGNIDDGWAHWYLVPGAATGYFVDNLYMATDPEGVYLTYNEFHFDTYVTTGATILPFSKEEVYPGGPTTVYPYRGMVDPGDGATAFAIRPAQMNSYGGYMHFLNNKFSGGNGFAHRWLIDPFGTTPTLVSSSVSTSTYSMPPNMQQPGGTYVESGDCRLTDLVYQSAILTPVFTHSWNPAGTLLSDIAVWTVDAMTHTQGNSVNMALTDSYMAFPSLDLDEQGHVGVAYAYSSNVNTEYVGVGYMMWDWDIYGYIAAGSGAPGLAEYTLGGAGTSGNPYEWGNYTGCAIDPADRRTFWTFGAYASDSPAPSWCTHVAAVSAVASSHLTTAPNAIFAAGIEGGPFVGSIFPVTLENSGGTDANWQVAGVPEWLTVGAESGQIAPHSSTPVNLTLNGNAYTLPPGEHLATIYFNNCTGTAVASCDVTLHIEAPIECGGSEIALAPPVGDQYLVAGDGDYSLFITPIEDIEVCAIGLALYPGDPAAMLVCRVYEADGNVRGPLVAANDHATVETIGGAAMVPMPMMLEACQDYEIVFQHALGLVNVAYDDSEFDYPFDVGGAVRVRQSAYDGNVAITIHAAMTIYASCAVNPGTAEAADVFTRQDVNIHGTSVTDDSRGLFVTATDNVDVHAVGVQGDLARGRWLTARLYKASGDTRGFLLSEGRTRVGTGGMASHEVPLHASLEAGNDYNVSLLVSDEALIPAVIAGDMGVPYGVDGVFDVNAGELGGVATDAIPHMWLQWEPIGYRGPAFDLAKSADGVPAPNTGSGPLDHGVFVKPVAGAQVYSLGVMADIPAGTGIIARLYGENMSGDRGALLSEGYVVSGGEGMRWHDVPLAVSWSPLIGYDLSIVCASTNAYPYWTDTSGMPYAPYGGALSVEDAEIGGSKAGTVLIHLRVGTCNEVLTAVGDRPPRFVPFSLDAAPNPTTGTVELRFSLDAAGTADLAVYDVLGRHVADVFRKRSLAAGPGTATFDTARLPSGVYFVQLRTATRGVSRKIVVTR